MKSIFKISTADQATQTSNDWRELIDLGITSAKTVLFLNFVLNEQLNNCSMKTWSSYRDADGVRGGGLLVKAKAVVTINDFNEVGLMFKNKYKIGTFVRVADGQAETIKSIKDKIGNEIKKAWKRFHTVNHLEDSAPLRFAFEEYGILEFGAAQPKYINVSPEIFDEDPNAGRKVISISFAEYRMLYEYFKGRDVKKSIDKHGRAAYDSMIGERIQDQFIIGMIEQVKAEIKAAESEFQQKVANNGNEFDAAYAAARKIRDDANRAAEEERNRKIKELMDQMNELMNTAKAAVMSEAV